MSAQLVLGLRSLYSDALTASREFLFGPRLIVCVVLQAAAADACAQCGWSLWILPALCGFGAWLGLTVRSLALGAALILLPYAMLGYANFRNQLPGPHDISKWVARKDIICTGTIISVDKLPLGDGRRHALIRADRMIFPDRVQLSGQMLATIYDGGSDDAIDGRRMASPLRDGDNVMLRASLRAPPAVRYAWQMDYAARLRHQGIHCVGNVFNIRKFSTSDQPRQQSAVEGALKSGAAAVDRVRARMVSVHRKFAGATEGDLLSSMVLGDRAVELSSELRHKFRDVGLSHVLAASGFNLSLVTGMTWWVSRLVVPWPWLVNLLCFLSMSGFVCLAGPSPSVMRAAIMITLMLASRACFRHLHAQAALSVALLISIIIDPHSIMDVGLQLSYAATAGIICGCSKLSAVLRGSGKFALPKFLAEAVAVVALAQSSVLPIQLAYFWQIGLFFLPANLIAAPLVSPVTILGFISSAVVITEPLRVWLEPVAGVLDYIAAFPLRFLLVVVDYLASWESAKLCLGPPCGLAIAIYYLGLICLSVALHVGKHRAVTSAGFAIALGGLLWRPEARVTLVAFFMNAIVIVHPMHSATGLGKIDSPAVARFLSYHGVRSGAVLAVKGSCLADNGVKIIELDLNAPADDAPPLIKNSVSPAAGCSGNDDCLIAVVKTPGVRKVDSPGRGTDEKETVIRLAEWIRHNRPRYLVLDYSRRSDRHILRSLEARVSALPGTQILRQNHEDLVLSRQPGCEWRPL